jgi:hypothetical protein
MGFKDLKLRKDEQAFHYYMQGDKQQQLEPPEVFLHFPGGWIGVTRCTDGSYWVHFSLDGIDAASGNREFKGKVVDARMDCRNLHVTQSKMGDISRPDLYHLALKIQPLNESIPF